MRALCVVGRVYVSFLHMTYIRQALTVSIKLPRSHRHPECVVIAAVTVTVLLPLSVGSCSHYIESNCSGPNHVFFSFFCVCFFCHYICHNHIFSQFKDEKQPEHMTRKKAKQFGEN